MDSLKGKSVIIKGASSGIGEGIALHLASLGCRLLLTGRNQENLDRVIGLCRGTGLTEDQIASAIGDLTKEENRKLIVDTAVNTFGCIDVLEDHVMVNNAGILSAGPFASVTPETYDDVFNTDVKSHYFLTQLALPHLIKSKGCVINNSSITGQRPYADFSVYCMAKASMDMFTQCLALELAPQGVRVNAINPAFVNTDIFIRGMHLDEKTYKETCGDQVALHPIGRIGQPQDCASAVAFLASDAANFITGQLLFVTGGRHLKTT